MGRLLITGAASVIGRALCARLAGEELVQVTSKDADFRKPPDVERLIARCAAQRFDGAAFVAGINMDGPLSGVSEETWDQVWDVNVRAHARLLFALSGAGAFSLGMPLLLVSSIVGFRGNPGQSAYAAAKGALWDLLGAACSLGLRANILLPPLVDSPLLSKLSPEAKRRLFASRLMQDPDPAASCAEAAAFLLSPQASYINRQAFHADSRISGLGLE